MVMGKDVEVAQYMTILLVSGILGELQLLLNWFYIYCLVLMHGLRYVI